MTLNDEVKQACEKTAYSSFCVEALAITQRYQDCMPVQTKNWLVERKDSEMLISTSTTSECLLRVRWYFVYIVAGWVCFAATIYRADIISWQTDCREPSRSHKDQFVSPYHIMTSSIPSRFISSGFIFSRKQACPWKLRKFAHSENFPVYISITFLIARARFLWSRPQTTSHVVVVWPRGNRHVKKIVREPNGAKTETMGHCIRRE